MDAAEQARLHDEMYRVEKEIRTLERVQAKGGGPQPYLIEQRLNAKWDRLNELRRALGLQR